MATVETTTYVVDISPNNSFSSFFTDDSSVKWENKDVGGYESTTGDDGLYKNVFPNIDGLTPDVTYYMRLRTKTVTVIDGVLDSTVYGNYDQTKTLLMHIDFLVDCSSSPSFSTFVTDANGDKWEENNVGYVFEATVHDVPAGIYYSRVKQVITWIIGGVTIDTETGAYSKVMETVIESSPTTSSEAKIYVETTGTSDASWKDMSRKINAKVNQAVIGTTATTVTIDTVFESGVSLTLSSDTLKNWIVYNVTKSKYSIVTASSATTITSLQYFGSDGLNFADNDDLIFYEFVGTLNATSTLGASPHIRFSPIETQRKVNILAGSSASVPVMGVPTTVCKRDARKYFYTTSSVSALTLDEGFYLENGGRGLDTSYTLHQAKLTSTATETLTATNWLDVVVSRGIGSADIFYNYDLFYVTIVYGGYQESDPVLRFGTMNFDASRSDYISTTIQFKVNPALMSKEVTGIRIYAMSLQQSVKDEFDEKVKLVVDKWFVLWKEVSIQSYDGTLWTIAPEELKPLKSAEFTYIYATEQIYSGGLMTIVDTLGHAIDTNRSYLAPRYAARPKSTGGSIVIVDQSDSVLRTSCYDGYGVHQDDNFPDVSIDNSGAKQKIYLTSDGELMGLGVVNDNVIAFKRTMVENIDLQSGSQRVTPADCVAKKSIITCDLGVFWAGKSAIYMMSAGSEQITAINQSWKNYYDGTLKTLGGSLPYINDYSRSQIISGYDPTYREVWFNIRTLSDDGNDVEYLNFRYSADGQWNIRKLNIDGNVVGFSRRKDSTLSIIYPYGILSYPNAAGSYPYQEAVPSDDSPSSLGYETSIRLHLGSLSGLMKNITPHSIIIDFVGESESSSDYFSVSLYANRETSPYNTQTFFMSGYPSVRAISPRGNVEQLTVDISIPSDSDLSNYKKLEVSSITVMYTEGKRIGNL